MQRTIEQQQFIRLVCQACRPVLRREISFGVAARDQAATTASKHCQMHGSEAYAPRASSTCACPRFHTFWQHMPLPTFALLVSYLICSFWAPLSRKVS